MPRARRTLSGDKAQPHRPVPNQPYGTGVEMAQLADAAPAPEIQLRADPRDTSHLTQVAQNYQMPPPTPLSAPSGRPNEPVTTGLRQGPGPGPEALVYGRLHRNRRAEILEAIAADNPDPRVQRLVHRARQAP